MIETFFPPFWLALGVMAAVALFVFLLRQELSEQPPFVRWSIIALRILLCLLVGWLIAQPRAITEKEETLPVSASLGIDVSESMLLADNGGKNTSRWSTPATDLDQSITLSEAAKIRLNLSSKQLHGKNLAQEVQKTIAILAEAKQKVEAYGRASSLERLTAGPAAKLASACKGLKEIDERQPVETLVHNARLVTEAALGLRRLDVIGTADPSESKPRIEWVQRWLEKAVPQFKQAGCDLRNFAFATDLVPLQEGQKPTVSRKDGTRLYENLNRLGAKAGPTRISFLVTDGVDSGGAGEFSAAVRDQPLIVLPIGDPDTRPDVRIDTLVGPAQVREKDVFQAVAQVSMHHNRPVTVTVNLRENERILATQQVPLKGDGSSERVELGWQAIGPGTKNLTVEVSPIQDEATLHNNSRPLTCNVTKDRYRILVCDAFPRWETRYLQNLFRRDPSIELASIVFEPRHTYPGKTPVEPPALPLSLEPWQKFDLVILGDLNPSQLTLEHQKLLVEYVNRGGNLLLIAGENSMPQAFIGAPLETLLPMARVQANELQGTFVISPPQNRPVHPMVRISQTDAASQWRTIFSATPEYRLSAWAKAKQSAQTLLVARDVKGGSHDFLAVQNIGSGRVAFAAAPSFYHLRFLFGDRYHLRFWGQMIRGMCMGDFGFGEGMVKTRLDGQLWESGSEVQGRVRIEDLEGNPVRNADFAAVLSRDGQPVARMKPVADEAKPDEYFLRFPDLPPGNYQLTYEGDPVERLWNMDRQTKPDPAVCRFQVLEGLPSEERQFATEPSPFWGKVNELPLGTTIHPQTLTLMLEALDLQPETTSLKRSRAIWDTWVLLLAIVSISGIEWLLRRIKGLC